PEDMARIVERIEPAIQRIQSLDDRGLMPTFYELATAIAFVYFHECKVEVAVLEVGLGGRLDAVNIVEPDVSVITPVSLDHMDVLGHTVAEIAEEKAGIIKTGRRVISAPQPPEAMEVISRVAYGRRARLDVVSGGVYVSTSHLPEVIADEEGVPAYQVFTLAYDALENAPAGKIRVKLPLLGSHQQVNAAVALSAVRTLSVAGVGADRKAIAKGFEKVEWPGRLEVIKRDPLVIVDGAHNADSMAKLMQAMYDLFERRKLIVVFGTMRDKDIEGIVEELGTGPGNMLGPRIEKVIVTRSQSPRAANPETVAGMAAGRGLYVEIRDQVSEALATAVGIARAASTGSEEDPIVLVTGSLFIVAEARQHYGLAPERET
ncbi:MAG: bifunctional folylpolyglutamate synthase/dihydrofolate synthase, partial [Chloroflexia bacterium]